MMGLGYSSVFFFGCFSLGLGLGCSCCLQLFIFCRMGCIDPCIFGFLGLRGGCCFHLACLLKTDDLAGGFLEFVGLDASTHLASVHLGKSSDTRLSSDVHLSDDRCGTSVQPVRIIGGQFLV